MEKSDKKAIVIMALSALLSIMVVCIPAPAGLSRAGQRVLGITILAIGFWSTELIPMGVTGMLVVVLLAVSGSVSGFQEALIGFPKPVPYFLIAVLTIGLAVSKSGLAEWIALFFLRR